MAGMSLLATVLVNALVMGITAGINCPPRISTNISITPCNYNEVKATQGNRMMQLPDGTYYLKVVVRNGISSLCVFRTSSTNTSFTLQLITSVEESPLCTPEQMLDCLQSSHVNFCGTDYFGISVWDQQSCSVQYLIVDTSTRLKFQKNLTNTSFHLQDLWYNALNCADYQLDYLLSSIIRILVLIMLPALCCGLICAAVAYIRDRVMKWKRAKR